MDFYKTLEKVINENHLQGRPDCIYIQDDTVLPLNNHLSNDIAAKGSKDVVGMTSVELTTEMPSTNSEPLPCASASTDATSTIKDLLRTPKKRVNAKSRPVRVPMLHLISPENKAQLLQKLTRKSNRRNVTASDRQNIQGKKKINQLQGLNLRETYQKNGTVLTVHKYLFTQL